MDAPPLAILVVFTFSLFLITISFLNPLIIWLVYALKGEKAVRTGPDLPPLSLVVVARNAAGEIESKIVNALSLDYPRDRYEIIVYSDGSTDAMEEKTLPFKDRNVVFAASARHVGKNAALNQAVQYCSGEIVAFSDVDAVLDRKALLELVKYFGDPDVGGVCGEKIILRNRNKLGHAQGVYTRFASMIKRLESRIGSSSTNDGTLYAIRKELFHPVPDAVTDDLYVCLSIISQDRRFIFVPEATATIEAPSKNTKHEIQRRRRIVSTSLRGLSLMRHLLNPLSRGVVAWSLLTNKVVRRLVPFFLITLFVSSIGLAFFNPAGLMALSLQSAFYLLALLHWPLARRGVASGIVGKASSFAYYFCVGNYGTMLGCIDFFRGKQVVKWEPVT